VTALARGEHADALWDLDADEVVDYRQLNPADLGTYDVILDPVSPDMHSYQPAQTQRPDGRHGRLPPSTTSPPLTAPSKQAAASANE
jgi:hypothetical protein